MTNSRQFILRSQSQKDAAIDAIRRCPTEPLYAVTVGEYRDKRSTAQNRKLWACLHDLATQVNWHGQHLSAAEWKDVLTAALKRQKVVPGIEGGFVVLGTSTSKMNVKEMSDMLELLTAFGTEQGVKWTDPELERIDQQI